MKNKIWLLQIPFVIIFTFCFYLTDAGIRGTLDHPFLREKVLPPLRSFSSIFTDIKFKTRGPVAPAAKIVIVDVDNESIASLGRWPWHRDVTAFLIEKSFQAGAKVVGLDMVFSEPDKRVPDELAEVLRQKDMGEMVQSFETDFQLQRVLAQNADRIVTGFASEITCQPGYSTSEDCPVMSEDALKEIPPGFEKFSFQSVKGLEGFDPQKTPIVSAVTVLENIALYNDVTLKSGFFQAFQDPDGYIRRTSLVMMAGGKVYPSLALAMATAGMQDDVDLKFTADEKIEYLKFINSNRNVAISPLGVMEINFRGPSHTFPYVSALDVMGDEEDIHVARGLASVGAKKTDILKDAYVLIGTSALGVFDMRAFPFDSNTPGVEGHANILDNLLGGDSLVYGGGDFGAAIVYVLMILGAMLIGYLIQRLEALPALLVFAAVVLGIGFIDQKVLFEKMLENWNTSFFYAEVTAIFAMTLSVKYVLEERNKKFIKGAFSKYVSPVIVDSILKDPTKLMVGGEKRDLTIVFSDIRSFTTFSEKLDPKVLTTFLNDYLGKMTDLVFDHEGTLDKYIGDAVVSFWGAPLDQPLHAANACKAAIAMIKKVNENRERWIKEYDVEVNVGIGINTGAVSVGNMGSERIFAYTVIGDHVNLAARLEGLTKYYHAGILTTRFTIESIQAANGDVPPHRVVDFVKVKGKKNAVEMIQVLAEEMNPEGMKKFEEARSLYRSQKWDEAKNCFEQSSKLLQEHDGSPDGASVLYMERCDYFAANPPGADWDGSWEMTSK